VDARDKGVSGSDGPVSRYLNRPLSRRISARVWTLPVTPDQWSYTSFGLVCAGAAAFAVRAPGVGAVLVHAGSVVDGMDGEVARLQGTSSKEGALLDLTLDRVADIALVGGLACGAGGRSIDWLLALAAANGLDTASVVKERVSAEGVPAAELQREERRDDELDEVLRFGGRDGRLFAVTLLGLMRQPRLALAWLAVSTNLRLWRRLGTARRLLRGLGRPGVPI
jgi:hypothetical protein